MPSVLLSRGASGPDRDPADELVALIAQLVRHRGFVRQKVVSALLLRHLPWDAGYAWRGQADLRTRLVKAALDPTTLDHLIANTRFELAMIQERSMP